MNNIITAQLGIRHGIDKKVLDSNINAILPALPRLLPI